MDAFLSIDGLSPADAGFRVDAIVSIRSVNASCVVW
jgi:hypothetical protein